MYNTRTVLVHFEPKEAQAVDAAVAHYRNFCQIEGAHFTDLEQLRDRMYASTLMHHEVVEQFGLSNEQISEVDKHLTAAMRIAGFDAVLAILNTIQSEREMLAEQDIAYSVNCD